MRRFLAVMSLLCAVTAVPAQEAAYSEVEVKDGGGVVGRVFFKDDYPKAERRRVNINIDTCGVRMLSERFVVDPDSKGLANAVLIIEGISEGKPFTAAEHAIEQIKCRYEPHVTVMRAGEDLAITNQDPILHNVHAYQGKDSLFNLAQPMKGSSTTRTLKKPGLVKLKCDVHPWMSSYIVIVESPYIAISDVTGSFSIADVPPGEYKVTMWHETLGRSSKTVTVTAGEDSNLDFTIGG